jgi:putative transposase
LLEAEAGVAMKELGRKRWLSEATYYAWRSNYGGMEVSDVKRLKSLDAESARLKRLLAEEMLENEVMTESLQNGNRTGPSGRGALGSDEGVVATSSA